MDKSIKINEDLLMNYYLFAAAKKSIFQDECKYHYIVRSTSASRQKLNEYKIYDPIRVKQIILEHCDQDIKILAKIALLNTCVYSYCALVLEKRNTLKKEKNNVRMLILEYYNCMEKLPKRTQVLAFGIAKMPRMFGILYPLYTKYLQKKKYE